LQVSECVWVSWVRPRGVNRAGAKALAARVAAWAAAVRAAADLLADRAPDLVL
jgi:hypothetical protein